MPADGDRYPGLGAELSNGRLDVAFADVAPRADNVGNDVNVEREVVAVAVDAVKVKVAGQSGAGEPSGEAAPDDSSGPWR